MKLKFKWKFLKKFFRREDPMKLKIFYIIKFLKNLFFGEKFNFFINNFIFKKLSFGKNNSVPLGITA